MTRTDADADVVDDGTVAFDAACEPHAIQWTPDGNLATADEGDLAEVPSGGRGWTVLSPEGEIVGTSGGAAEQALADVGRHPDDKGAELEGAGVATLRGTTYAFLGSERGDAVPVYDIARGCRGAAGAGAADRGGARGARRRARRHHLGVPAVPGLSEGQGGVRTAFPAAWGRTESVQVAAACQENIMYPIVLCAFR